MGSYGNGNHSKSAMCPCHRPGGMSMMACGNIIKEDQDFGILWNRMKARYSLCLFSPIVCPLFGSVVAKN